MSKNKDEGSSDNHKSRGIKHLRNKKKYGRHRSDITQVAALSKQKKHIVLDSNWDRYEQEEEDENLISASTNFSILASAPISSGSHFAFKSRRDVGVAGDLCQDNFKTSELFNLDLNLLEQSLSTIPFSIRSGIGEDLFTETQKKFMASSAKENEVKYSDYCRNITTGINQSIFDFIVSEEINTKKSDIEKRKSVIERLQVQDEIHDRKLTENQNKEDPLQNNSQHHDLEQWLDDVLDD